MTLHFQKIKEEKSKMMGQGRSYRGSHIAREPPLTHCYSHGVD